MCSSPWPSRPRGRTRLWHLPFLAPPCLSCLWSVPMTGWLACPVGVHGLWLCAAGSKAMLRQTPGPGPGIHSPAHSPLQILPCCWPSLSHPILLPLLVTRPKCPCCKEAEVRLALHTALGLREENPTFQHRSRLQTSSGVLGDTTLDPPTP